MNLVNMEKPLEGISTSLHSTLSDLEQKTVNVGKPFEEVTFVTQFLPR